MDFNVQKTKTGERIRNYELKLDVVTTDFNNAFDTKNISEDEFNN